MEPIPASTEKSVRSCRGRENLLLMFNSLGEGYPRQLARALGVDPTRVRWMLHGKPPYYSVELSLLAQGLVEEVKTNSGRVYAITTRGRRKARSIARRRRKGLP